MKRITKKMVDELITELDWWQSKSMERYIPDTVNNENMREFMDFAYNEDDPVAETLQTIKFGISKSEAMRCNERYNDECCHSQMGVLKDFYAIIKIKTEEDLEKFCNSNAFDRIEEHFYYDLEDKVQQWVEEDEDVE